MQENSLTTTVYRYNPNANAVIIGYAVCFFWFFYSLFHREMGTVLLLGPALLLCAGFLIFTRNPKYRLRTWDKRLLTLQSTGISFGGEDFPVAGLEVVSVYLDAFQNFEYREVSGQRRGYYVRADGDQNKLSFRSGGTVYYFTFYLKDYPQFCLLKTILAGWQAAGVNVALKQTFEDGFMLHEMKYYETNALN